jgi:subtilase family serine protease
VCSADAGEVRAPVFEGGAYAISPGTHTIGVLVDDVDRIAESNKNNNALSESITVP